MTLENLKYYHRDMLIGLNRKIIKSIIAHPEGNVIFSLHKKDNKGQAYNSPE